MASRSRAARRRGEQLNGNNTDPMHVLLGHGREMGTVRMLSTKEDILAAWEDFRQFDPEWQDVAEREAEAD